MNDLTTIPKSDERGGDVLPGWKQDDIAVFKAGLDPSNKLTWPQLRSFLELCIHLKLDPRRKQIHATAHWNSNTNRLELTPIISIDGFRLIAERTGKYAPGSPTVYIQGDEGNLVGATVFIKKMTGDGTWHETSETAFLSEYMPQNEKKAFFWRKMPSVMIAKVAEARALRRAFPDAFSGIYGEEEMHQSKENETENSPNESTKEPSSAVAVPIADPEFIDSLKAELEDYPDLKARVLEFVNETFNGDWYAIPQATYQMIAGRVYKEARKACNG